MKNTMGSALTLTLFGESHGAEIGAVLDGLAPGIEVSEEKISEWLSLRRPQGAVSTARREPDPFRIVSGVHRGKTTGTPLCLLIPNVGQRSSDYESEDFLLRPGHADFTAQMKYHGYQDKRGGGHFSGRITAPIVAAGAIVGEALKKKGIFIGTHMLSCADVRDREFDSLREDIAALSKKAFPVLSEERAKEMEEKILEAKGRGDSVGGILESAVIGLPAGVGEPWFDSLESLLSHGLFSIPAVKGVEFGAGFEMASLTGLCANDAFVLDKNGNVCTETNRNGGINGGISNGMPLVIRMAVKPTPTVSAPQKTVEWNTRTESVLSSGGRHDPCIVHRARIVADSIIALVLADALTVRFGTDYLA
ncbi:MAG: chorismate synthase [Clostridia bacterium]|nr:chorismate synthase [Clostridia bacterium]